MKERLREILRGTDAGPAARNLVREYLQANVLGALQRAGAMVPLAFQGGTALRFLYPIRRHSEDLDFALERPDRGYDFRGYLEAIRADLEREGYRVDLGKPQRPQGGAQRLRALPGAPPRDGAIRPPRGGPVGQARGGHAASAGGGARNHRRPPARPPADPAPRPRLAPGWQAPRDPAEAVAQGPRLLRSRLVPERPDLARSEPGPAEQRARPDRVDPAGARRGELGRRGPRAPPIGPMGGPGRRREAPRRVSRGPGVPDARDDHAPPRPAHAAGAASEISLGVQPARGIRRDCGPLVALHDWAPGGDKRTGRDALRRSGPFYTRPASAGRE